MQNIKELNNFELRGQRISDEDKEALADDFSGGNYFNEGVHKVQIQQAKILKTAEQKHFVKFDVLGENGEVAEVRTWLVGDAKKYTLRTIQAILVHNVEEANKQAARDKFSEIASFFDLSAFLVKMNGKEAWVKVEKKEFENENGQTKTVFEKKIFGFEPKSKSSNAENLDTKNAEMDLSQPVDLNDIPF